MSLRQAHNDRVGAMSHKPIVAGIDNSAASGRAAAVAYRIAEAAGVPCQLIHAVPPTGPARIVVPGRPPAPEVWQEARREMESLLNGHVPPAVLERLEVLVGRAGVILADAARRANAELVVLGGKPHGAVARGLGGSTAQYLVRTLDIPLLVTGPTDRPMSRVLVAVDLSYASRPTLQAARRLADRLGAQLRVLHVVEPVRSRVGAARRADADPEALARTAAKILRRLVEAELGVGGAEPVVRQGPAAEEIVAEAASWGADVIVMGSHGKGWVDRLLVGSATERLLATLPTALLVVPTYPARRDRAARPGRKRHPTRRREPYASR